MSTRKNKREIRIEPERGETYATARFAAYEYSVYPDSSVLAGQQRRHWLDSFDTIEEAKDAFREAIVCGSSGHVSLSLGHLPGDDDADPYGDNLDAEFEMSMEGDR